jgi:hypothetical protein
MVSRIDGYGLLVTKVVERLNQSSAALTCTDPCIAGGTLDIVRNANILYDFFR